MPAKGRVDARHNPPAPEAVRPVSGHFMSRAPLRPAKLSTALTLNEYNRFCRSLRHTTHVVQWGGAHVWKVSGKVFAIGRWNDDDQQLFITFKCSPMSYDMLKEISGCRPAPYLASRGMKWIQRTSAEELDDTGLKDYLRASYDHVIKGLPKRTQQHLGLTDTSRQVKTTAQAAARSKAKPASRPAAQAPTNTKTKPTRARAAQRKGASQ